MFSILNHNKKFYCFILKLRVGNFSVFLKLLWKNGNADTFLYYKDNLQQESAKRFWLHGHQSPSNYQNLFFSLIDRKVKMLKILRDFTPILYFINKIYKEAYRNVIMHLYFLNIKMTVPGFGGEYFLIFYTFFHLSIDNELAAIWPVQVYSDFNQI